MHISLFVNTVNIMDDTVNSKYLENTQSSKKGLYVKEDDQDWGSAGMNDVQSEQN